MKASEYADAVNSFDCVECGHRISKVVSLQAVRLAWSLLVCMGRHGLGEVSRCSSAFSRLVVSEVELLTDLVLFYSK